MNPRKPRGSGASKFEFAVVLVIFGVLTYILLDRLTALEQETEKLEVDLTVRHINIGLKLVVGERIMRGEEPRIVELLDANPLDFLGRPPKAIVGAGGTANAPGSWHFDPASHDLRYHPRQPEAFGNQEKLAWRLRGQTDEIGRAVGLRLEPVQ